MLNDFLTHHVGQMNIKLSTGQTQQLLDYLDLLAKWNKSYNLTAITDKKEMLIKHILDSLSVVAYMNEYPLLDVGSGAGLPGIVIAIVKPKLSIVLLDSVGKKCRFMQMASATLGLNNITIAQTRLENYQPAKCFGQITCRAFASVHQVRQLSQHLLCDNGCYLLMKSDKFLQEELLPKQLTPYELVVPQIKDKRYLLILNKYD